MHAKVKKKITKRKSVLFYLLNFICMCFSFSLELFGLIFASLITIYSSVLGLDGIYFGKCFLTHPPSLEETGQVPTL